MALAKWFHCMHTANYKSQLLAMALDLVPLKTAKSLNIILRNYNMWKLGPQYLKKLDVKYLKSTVVFSFSIYLDPNFLIPACGHAFIYVEKRPKIK